ncbi:MAG: class I SAM-dependent methyltransferase [Flavobacteriales bacterium]|nr:class I SAM-dependent methyltransferase [Flavobacteriales bacterium]
MSTRVKQDFESYWAQTDNTFHANQDQASLNKYAAEICYLVGFGHRLLDCGCGNGDFLPELSRHFKKITAIDFSEKMLEKASEQLQKEGIGHVELMRGDIRDLKELCKKETFDVILCNAALQYLTVTEAEQFVRTCKGLLNENGKLVLMNIPDRKLKSLYLTNLYKDDGSRSDMAMFFQSLRARFYLFRKKLFSNRKGDSAQIGTWFTYHDFKNIASKSGMSCYFSYSMYPPYGYRFHVEMYPQRS